MRTKKLNFSIRIFVFLIVLSFLFPAIQLFGFGMKPDLLFLYPLFITICIVDVEVKSIKMMKEVFVIALFIFLSMLLSNTLGEYHFFSTFSIKFPTEFLQILNRVLIFYCFFVIGYNNIIKERDFKLLTSIIFIISLTFGLLQALAFQPVIQISSIFALSDNQVKGFESLNSRIFGTSGNILTWAGLCGFFFLYYFFLLKDYKWLRIVGMALSLINILYSMSRGAIIALFVTMVFSFMLRSLYEKRISKFVLRMIQVLIIGYLSATILYNIFPERIDVFLTRMTNLDSEVSEVGRAAQLASVKQFFDRDMWNYLFGIGKAKLDSIGLMEVEFLFILFAYGVLGIALTYLMIFKVMSKSKLLMSYNTDVSFFVICSFVFYLIFSFGYFFIKEIYSGLIFWYVTAFYFGCTHKKIIKNEQVQPH